MSTLLENPGLIAFLGAVTAIVFGFLYLQIRRRAALVACLAVVVLTVGAMILAQSVVTDREAIEAVLNEAAQAVARNDVKSLVQFIHSDAPEIRSRAEAEMPQYEFQEVNIKSNLEISFDRENDPTEAVATFNVVVVVSDRSGLLNERRVPRYCSVTFRKDQGQWRVVGYDHDDPREGFRVK